MQMRAVIVIASLLCTACGSLPNGREWGQDATFTPAWARIKASATNAARDPWVWAPLAGAAIFQIDDWDHRTADWAQRHTPVFGSQRSAETWSDDLRTASGLAHYVTIAATPSGDEPSEWLVNKAKGTLVHVAAVSGTVLITQTLKTTVDRERPNGQGTESFPSGHTSTSAVHTRLASRNLRSIEMTDATRTSLDVGLYALTIGTSWSRIEAGWHYPSDTLVGMALGNFMASFLNDAFLGLDNETMQISLAPVDRGALLHFGMRF
jgi:membrane-associated phospholipid phosphatase